MSTMEELLQAVDDSPAMRRAELLVENDGRLISDLIQLRKQSHLTQSDVAATLGISQASVAAFERYDNDPKLSTIRRYAQAIGALVAHKVEADTGQLFDHRRTEWMPVAISSQTFTVADKNFGTSRAGQVHIAAEQVRTDFALGA